MLSFASWLTNPEIISVWPFRKFADLCHRTSTSVLGYTCLLPTLPISKR